MIELLVRQVLLSWHCAARRFVRRFALSASGVRARSTPITDKSSLCTDAPHRCAFNATAACDARLPKQFRSHGKAQRVPQRCDDDQSAPHPGGPAQIQVHREQGHRAGHRERPRDARQRPEVARGRHRRHVVIRGDDRSIGEDLGAARLRLGRRRPPRGREELGRAARRQGGDAAQGRRRDAEARPVAQGLRGVGGHRGARRGAGRAQAHRRRFFEKHAPRRRRARGRRQGAVQREPGPPVRAVDAVLE